MTERDQIQKLMRDNAGDLQANLGEFFVRTVEDLAAAGVDPHDIAFAMLTTAGAHLTKLDGFAAAASELRKFADGLDRVGARFEGPRH